MDDVIVEATAEQIYAWYADMRALKTLTEAQKKLAHGFARLSPQSVKDWIEAQKVKEQE